MSRSSRPLSGLHPVGAGTAELLADADRPGSWMLLVNGTPQSHVDLDEPTHLDFEYVRRLGHVVDLAAPPGTPLTVVHLGAGALTLARYVAATRPSSRQRAFDTDAALVELVRQALPLPRSTGVRVRIEDARTGLASLRPHSADLIVADVFTGARTPAHLTTVEFAREAVRVLREAGTFAINIGDGPPLTFTRSEVATVRACFSEVCLLADPGVLRGRRFGNLVCVGSRRELPVAALTRRCAADPVPSRVVSGRELARFVGAAAVIADASATDSPEPPAGLFASF